MRTARIKVDAEAGEAVYHCMSRTVNGERLLDDVAKEVLRKQMWQIADYCGVQVITYAIMSNHFHVLLRVPQKQEIPDSELLRRYGVLYPKPTRYQTAKLEVIKGQLAKDGDEAVAWRQKQTALMGDVSAFMKLLKQRFSVWYNRSHQRYGTLWAERFKSVLVEAKSGVMATMAAYIDLNAVRAGLVEDPKDYRFCGYGDALGGNLKARQGLTRLVECPGQPDWATVQASYRQRLFGTGSAPKQKAGKLDPAKLQQVVRARGQLPQHEVLRCRIRYFSDGAVLGSREFIQKYLSAYRTETGRRSRTAPRPLPRVTDWGDLATLRGLRRSAFG